MLEDRNNKDKNDIVVRLRKIEGQVKGIQKMIEEEKCCSDVMIQISAIRSAINKVGGILMDKYINECMSDTLKKSLEHNETDEQISKMIDTIVRYVK